MNFEKILIINLGGIGDMLLSMPALKALARRYHSAKIYMLISDKLYEIVKDFPFVSGIFTFKINYGGKIPLNGLTQDIKTLWFLRKEKFDLALNMRTLVSEKSANKMSLLLDIINPKKKAGRDTEGRGKFFDIRIFEPILGTKYEMEYDIDTAAALGAEVKDRNIDFNIDPQSVEKVNSLLLKEAVTQDDIVIAIHPGGMPSRRWPAENFAKVIKGISAKIKARFVITGSHDEQNLANELIGLTGPEVISLSGKLDFKELGALIKRVNLFISNDTGPMHIAAILKTPLVAIFGPGDVTRFDPQNITDKVRVLYEGVNCAPCEKVECNNMKCLGLIKPEQVIEVAIDLLEDSGGKIEKFKYK